MVDDFNSLTDVLSVGGITLYPAESEDTLGQVQTPHIRDWTPVKANKPSLSPSPADEEHKIRKEQVKVDLGFLQVLSDSDEEENDANENVMQDAGFMALLSDSEDETNNNESDKKVGKQEEEVETTKFKDQEVPLFPLPEEKQNTIIDGSFLESDSLEPMHTLFRPRYDLEEDTRRPYNKWITDISVGAGWKMKRKGAGIIYKDKKGSIFKSRFRALKHLISRQTLKI